MGSIKPLASRIPGRLIVLSNRGPCIFRETDKNIYSVPSVSGLVSAVEPIISREGGVWIAWGGRSARDSEVPGITRQMPERDSRYIFHELLLTEREIALYYDGFANSCLWPLCHNFVEKAVFNKDQWDAFCGVNRKYAETALKVSSGNDLLWVHDYHLAGVPSYARELRPDMRISLFWHIPFPPAEVFSVMPWAKKYIEAMLSADLIGFHTTSYARNFLQAAEMLLGAQVDYEHGIIYGPGRTTRVVAIPIGINWQEFEQLASSPEVVLKSNDIRSTIGCQFVLLGIDRLDYTKGIPERLNAFGRFLEENPQYRGKVTYIQVVVPSRTETGEYRRLRRRIEEIVARINGDFTEDHIPVRYLFRALDRKDVVAHYLAADMALVTPVKDGLNLVAKEYVAAKAGGSGVLLLSPFAGAADQLKEAITVNPYDLLTTASKIRFGLEMAIPEKKRRMESLGRIVREQDVNWWWQQFRMHWLVSAPEVLHCDPAVGFSTKDTGSFGSHGVNSP